MVYRIDTMVAVGSHSFVGIVIYCLSGLSLCVIFSLSGLYVVSSLRCFIDSAMYSLLSWTTIVDPYLLCLLLALDCELVQGLSLFSG